MRDAGRLDEQRLAGAARAMDDARELVAVVDGDRQDVMVAADRGIGIAKDLAEFGVAQQGFLIWSWTRSSRSASFRRTWPVPGWPRPARGRGHRCAADRLGDQAQVLDRRQQVDQTLRTGRRAASGSGTMRRCKRACRPFRAVARPGASRRCAPAGPQAARRAGRRTAGSAPDRSRSSIHRRDSVRAEWHQRPRVVRASAGEFLAE